MNIAVVGTGKEYKKNKEVIFKYFNVVGLFDSSVIDGKVKDGISLRNISKISEVDFDKVLVCSRKYRYELIEYLKANGILDNKIMQIEFLDQYWELLDCSKYENDRVNYIKLYDEYKCDRFAISEEQEPHLSDYRKDAGTVDEHYFIQDMIVAKKIIDSSTGVHFDVGSRIDGLISHLLVAGVDVTEVDIRPLDHINLGREFGNLNFIQCDATKLQIIESNTIESLSSCHAVEHFGLGRYGDAIDPLAWKKGLDSLQRVLKKDGRLYLSLPVGRMEKLLFNSCRVFDPMSVIKCLDQLILNEMYLISNYKIYKYTDIEVLEKKYQSILGEYDCGIFIFSK